MASVARLLVVVILLAGAWSVLVTLFTPPLTSGWREGIGAAVRRWPRAVVLVGPIVAGVATVWWLVGRVRGG